MMNEEPIVEAPVVEFPIVEEVIEKPIVEAITIADIKAEMIAKIDAKTQIMQNTKSMISAVEMWVREQGTNITKMDRIGDNRITFILNDILIINNLLALGFKAVLIEQSGRITITL